jgi:hypothetical protein
MSAFDFECPTRLFLCSMGMNNPPPNIPRNNEELGEWSGYILRLVMKRNRFSQDNEDLHQHVFVELSKGAVDKFWQRVEGSAPYVVTLKRVCFLLGVKYGTVRKRILNGKGEKFPAPVDAKGKKLPHNVKVNPASLDTLYNYGEVVLYVAGNPFQGQYVQFPEVNPSIGLWVGYLKQCINRIYMNRARDNTRRYKDILASSCPEFQRRTNDGHDVEFEANVVDPQISPEQRAMLSEVRPTIEARMGKGTKDHPGLRLRAPQRPAVEDVINAIIEHGYDLDRAIMVESGKLKKHPKCARDRNAGYTMVEILSQHHPAHSQHVLQVRNG